MLEGVIGGLVVLEFGEAVRRLVEEEGGEDWGSGGEGLGRSLEGGEVLQEKGSCTRPCNSSEKFCRGGSGGMEA